MYLLSLFAFFFIGYTFFQQVFRTTRYLTVLLYLKPVSFTPNHFYNSVFLKSQFSILMLHIRLYQCYVGIFPDFVFVFTCTFCLSWSIFVFGFLVPLLRCVSCVNKIFRVKKKRQRFRCYLSPLSNNRYFEICFFIRILCKTLLCFPSSSLMACAVDLYYLGFTESKVQFGVNYIIPHHQRS